MLIFVHNFLKSIAAVMDMSTDVVSCHAVEQSRDVENGTV